MALGAAEAAAGLGWGVIFTAAGAAACGAALLAALWPAVALLALASARPTSGLGLAAALLLEVFSAALFAASSAALSAAPLVAVVLVWCGLGWCSMSSTSL